MPTRPTPFLQPEPMPTPGAAHEPPAGAAAAAATYADAAGSPAAAAEPAPATMEYPPCGPNDIPDQNPWWWYSNPWEEQRAAAAAAEDEWRESAWSWRSWNAWTWRSPWWQQDEWSRPAAPARPTAPWRTPAPKAASWGNIANPGPARELPPRGEAPPVTQPEPTDAQMRAACAAFPQRTDYRTIPQLSGHRLRPDAVARLERKIAKYCWDFHRANPPSAGQPGGTTRIWSQHEMWTELAIARTQLLEVIWRQWGRGGDPKFIFYIEPETGTILFVLLP